MAQTRGQTWFYEVQEPKSPLVQLWDTTVSEVPDTIYPPV